jgi:hypothetical protein
LDLFLAGNINLEGFVLFLLLINAKKWHFFNIRGRSDTQIDLNLSHNLLLFQTISDKYELSCPPHLVNINLYILVCIRLQ